MKYENPPLLCYNYYITCSFHLEISVIDQKKLTHDFAIQSMKCTIIQPHPLPGTILSSRMGNS
jgi:hypothetical protein